MADNADIAQEQLENMQKFTRTHSDQYTKPSAKFCDECGVEIPEKRRSLGGVRLCIACQSVQEQQNKHFFKRA